MLDERWSRRQFLKMGTVISMSTLMTGCASALKSPGSSAAAPRLRLMALGGPMNDPERAARGVEALRHIGFELENLDCVSRRASRFAGSLEERLADLNQLAESGVELPDMLMATRGGYGAVQLLDHLDYARLGPLFKQHGTILMGYSDNTAVQLALLAQCGVISFSGPMLYSDFTARRLSGFTQSWLRTVLTEPSFSLKVDQPQQHAVACTGMLWGGNLTVLTSLVGSRYFPQVSQGILFLEDVGEDVYRVERMLQQLRLAGVLSRQSAVVLGHFSAQRADGFDPDGYTMAEISRSLSRQTGVPILSGLPIGHVHDIVPLPIGAQAQLAGDERGFTLTVSGYPTLSRVPANFQTDVDRDALSQVKG